MALDRYTLALIGRRLPAVFDVIPRDPFAVALNPQPVPPREIGAALASEYLRMLSLQERLGIDPARANGDLDDWCPTPPRLPRFPLWWPPLPIPDPQPDWTSDLHLGFAARLAATPLTGSALSKHVDAAIERSVRIIEAAAR